MSVVYKTVTEDKLFLVEGDVLDKTNLYIKKRYKKKHDDNVMRGLRSLSQLIESEHWKSEKNVVSLLIPTKGESMIRSEEALRPISTRSDKFRESARRK